MESTAFFDGKRNDLKEQPYLATYIKSLEKKLRNVESENALLEVECQNLQEKRDSLKKEINELKTPALLVGTLTDILDDFNYRVIISIDGGQSYVTLTNSEIRKRKLIPGMKVALKQHDFSIMKILPSFKDPIIKEMELIESFPDGSYDKIGGLEEEIEEIREVIELPLIKPYLFELIGIIPPKGILFHGPPGTGKTLIARAVARETHATFIKVVGSELIDMFIGEGARYIRELFDLAKQKAPSIIFIDEIDAIGTRRLREATSGDREVERTLMQLLNELDGFDERGNVKIIAATNRIDTLDKALLRPGRFDRIIEFPLPNVNGRKMIFTIYIEKLNLGEILNIDQLVNLTKNATGADIKAICTEAGMFAIRRNANTILQKDFLNAIDKIMKTNNSDLKNRKFSHYI